MKNLIMPGRAIGIRGKAIYYQAGQKGAASARSPSAGGKTGKLPPEVEAGVLERLKKLPNGYTSSKQVLTKKN